MSRKVSKHAPSSGLKKLRASRRSILRLQMKVNRWKRYQTTGKRCTGIVPDGKNVSDKRSASTKSRHNSWDTTKMEQYIQFLEGVS